jgi:hypothetical protein
MGSGFFSLPSMPFFSSYLNGIAIYRGGWKRLRSGPTAINRSTTNAHTLFRLLTRIISPLRIGGFGLNYIGFLFSSHMAVALQSPFLYNREKYLRGSLKRYKENI